MMRLCDIPVTTCGLIFQAVTLAAWVGAVY